jgi:hypothetical protein
METAMPLSFTEGNVAEGPLVAGADAAHVWQINDETGIQLLCSFLSAGQHGTCWLHQDAEAIRIAAPRPDVPANLPGVVSESQPEQIVSVPTAD